VGADRFFGSHGKLLVFCAVKNFVLEVFIKRKGGLGGCSYLLEI